MKQIYIRASKEFDKMYCVAHYDKLFIAYMTLQKPFQAAISENELFLKNTEWIHWILEIQLKYVHLSRLFTFTYNSNLKLSAAKKSELENITHWGEKLLVL